MWHEGSLFATPLNQTQPATNRGLHRKSESMSQSGAELGEEEMRRTLQNAHRSSAFSGLTHDDSIMWPFIF